MASTYSNRLKLELMEAGANTGTWGNNTNDNLQVVDAAIGGYLSKSVAGNSNVTLSQANRDPDVETTNEAANKVIEFTGTLSGNIYVFLPAVEKEYIFYNNTSGSYTLTVAPTGHAANGVVVTQSSHTVMYNKNGTKMVDLFANSLGTLSANTISASSLNATTITGNGAGLTGIDAFPSGTSMLFQQTTAPTGWTKQTTHDNKALRIVSGSVSSGGSNTFAAAFNTNNTVSGTTAGAGVTITGSTGSTTLTLSQIPAHGHRIFDTTIRDTSLSGENYGSHKAVGIINASGAYLLNSEGTSTPIIEQSGGGSGHTHGAGTLSGSSHTHTFSSDLNLDVQYVDFIIANKD